jgi:DNA adenine methylase
MPPRVAKPNAPVTDDPGWLHYVEPFAGGLSVLLANDPEGISEVVNDLNYELSNFWCALQSAEAFAEFKRRVDATPFSQGEFEGAHIDPPMTFDKLGGMTARAVNFFIRCRQSLSGRMDSFTGITRLRARRGMNAEVSAWLNAIEGLPAVHDRLKRVLVLNRDALDVIRSEDGPRTLFYLDPPYLHETRATTKEYGSHEMSDGQHLELLTALTHIKGRFMLSGYRSKMYDLAAENGGWTRHDFETANHASGGKEKRRMTECLWCNFNGVPA